MDTNLYFKSSSRINNVIESHFLISQPLLQLQRRQEGPDGGVGTSNEVLETVVPPLSKVRRAWLSSKADISHRSGSSMKAQRGQVCWESPSSYSIEVLNEGIHVSRKGGTKCLPGVIHILWGDEGKSSDALKSFSDILTHHLVFWNKVQSSEVSP